jgi:hypothetical protein
MHMLYYRTHGAKEKFPFRKCEPAQDGLKKNMRRFGATVKWPPQMASSIARWTPAA